MIGDGICQNTKNFKNLFYSPLSHIHTFSMHIGDRFEDGLVWMGLWARYGSKGVGLLDWISVLASVSVLLLIGMLTLVSVANQVIEELMDVEGIVETGVRFVGLWVGYAQNSVELGDTKDGTDGIGGWR